MSSGKKHADKQGFWKEHSEGWKSSGLTQVDYCAQQGISYQRFAYQHHRMACKSQRSTGRFVEVKPEPVTVSIQTAGLQLMLPNGIRIGITNEVNPGLLKTVLTIAGGLPC